MKKLAWLTLAALATLRLCAAESEWQSDLTKAQAKARAENKLVLMDFTGSDWCSWCKKFDAEVLSRPEFKEYAAKNLVLVEVDFPAKKQQSATLKKANDSLKGKFKVEAFPTFVVLNKDGKEVGRQEGYEEGGPKAFISKLEGFKKKS
ncbi:MAG TPA: thioredoxin family protein [Verrucomicrobiae bacterium]|nr:thioredoxin family protein [Verrucomicrobiae bacterium]